LGSDRIGIECIITGEIWGGLGGGGGVENALEEGATLLGHADALFEGVGIGADATLLPEAGESAILADGDGDLALDDAALLLRGVSETLSASGW
jgi:hypothetical protein